MSSIEQSLTLPASSPSSAHAANLARGVWRIFSRWAAVVLFLAFWEIVPRAHWVEPAFLPPFSEVMRSAWRLLANGQLVQHVEASLSRSLAGFALAIGSAIPLGLLIGWNPRLAAVVHPFFVKLRHTAPLAL